MARFQVGWRVWFVDGGHYRRGTVVEVGERLRSPSGAETLKVQTGPAHATSMRYLVRATDCLPTLDAQGLIGYYNEDGTPQTGWVVGCDLDHIRVNDACTGERVLVGVDELIDVDAANAESPEAAHERVGLVYCPKCACPHLGWVMADCDPGSEAIWWAAMWQGEEVDGGVPEVDPWCGCEPNNERLRAMYAPLMAEVARGLGGAMPFNTPLMFEHELSDYAREAREDAGL